MQPSDLARHGAESAVFKGRLGEIYAQQGNREAAVKFLRLASGARAKNPDVAAQADKFLREMGS